jgi:hypothetical protein
MTLQPCYACGEEISTTVEVCPHCGAKRLPGVISTFFSIVCLLLAVPLALIALLLIFMAF